MGNPQPRYFSEKIERKRVSKINYKNIHLNGEESQYIIYDNGKVYNTKTKKFLQGTSKTGYLVYNLRFNGKRYYKLAHRLVAEYFLNNLEKLPVVNHKDGNKLNNNVNNLEWVTYSENNLHAYNNGLKERTNSISERNKINLELTGEEWKQYNDTNFYISNFGRIKNNATGNILKGKITKDGYIEYCLSINGVKKSFVGHRLVYQTFMNVKLPKKDIINHKDGNKLNNQLSNLELVDASYNSLHSYYIIKNNPKIKTVYKYSLDKKLLNEYPSCAVAAKENEGCYANNISNCCNGKLKTHNGFIWSYIKY